MKQVIKAGWSRHRFRLFKHYQDAARENPHPVTICLEHRCLLSKCHCKQTEQHRHVTPRIEIPKMRNVKAWQRLAFFLNQGGDAMADVKYIVQDYPPGLPTAKQLLPFCF